MNVDGKAFGLFVGPEADSNALLLFHGNSSSYDFQVSRITSFDLERWIHVVVSYDGTDIKSYINGLPAGARSSTILDTSLADILIGTRVVPNSDPAEERDFHGAISEVAIYNRALSSAEVGQLYQQDVGSLDTDGDGLTDAWERGYGRYQIVPGNFTWEQAKADAEARGGHLATITSAAERDMAVWENRSLMEANTLYLGATDAREEGTWEWVTGETWGFSQWAPNQPDNSANQDYSVILPNPYFPGWDDHWNFNPNEPVQGYLLEYGYPTDPTKADTDEDGFNDSIESHYASDPNNPAVTPNTIRPAGRVVGWGQNGEGQISIPESAQSGVTAIATGNTHSLALKSDGSVVGWGLNSIGQITIPQSAQSGVTAIAVGWYHSLALKADGSVVGWGDNNYGQITIPQSAQSGVTAIAAGYLHSLALKADGSVVGWGWTTIIPQAAQSGVTAIAAAYSHSLALKADGSVVAWGDNNYGQITIPQTAQSGVTAIAASHFHSLALKSDGSVVGWGWNSNGQINIPQSAQSEVMAIAAGPFHSLVLKSDGSVVGWGSNSDGQINIPQPAKSGVTAIAAGGYRSLAVTTAPAEEPPTIGLTPNPISFLEGASGRTVGTITLADPDGTASDLIVTLGGLDASYFSVSGTGATRNLVLALPTDFESGKTSFTFTLTVTDVQGLSATVNATASLLDDRTEDKDGDGLTEQQEEDTYGTSDLLTDTDGDGLSDPFEISLGTDPKSETFSIDGLTNGTFEEGPTLPPNGTFYFIPQAEVRGWRTSASDRIIELWGSGHNGVPAEQGRIFAELDANMRGTLYQDVIMTRSGYVDYSFLHRARNPSDSMQFKIEELVGGPGSAVASVRYSRDLSTGQTWTRHEGGQVTTVTAGKVYRFSYVSLSAGYSSVGNFLDDAKFGIGVVQGIPPAILSSNSILGTVGQSLNYQVEATGTAHLIFSASNLPGNTAIGSANGVITGTPQTAGSGTATVVVTNSYGAVTNALAWNIAPASGSISFTNLIHTYDRTGKVATVVVNPTNATYALTYNGLTNLPVNAGSYTVVGTLTGNYSGV